jgi:ABC-type hemin transport system ATPase subunit
MLRVEKLSYEVKGRKLLKDISFQLRKGEVLALLGANGAGKSSLMRLLCGDKVPTEGQISLMGKPLRQYTPIELAKTRAMLAQHNNVTMAFNVREIVLMGRYPHYKSVPSAHDRETVDEVMEVCGLEAFADRSYLSLSGGEQQRVQLARVLAQIWDHPDSLLLLDEPVSALDLKFQQQVLALAKALSRRGYMVVVVLHDVNLAAVYADRILMLKNGRKWCEGTPVEVMEKKNIYAVFSVQADVAIDPKTLQPIVRLEELYLNAHEFNTKLPVTPISKSAILEDWIRHYRTNPYIDLEKVTAEVGCSALELLKLAYPLQVGPLNNDFEGLLRDIVKLGAVHTFAYSRVGQIEFRGSYTEPISTPKALVIDNGVYRMELRTSQWKVGVAVNNEWGKGFHFYDTQGRLVHKIVLIEGLSNLSTYDKLLEQYGTDKLQMVSMAAEAVVVIPDSETKNEDIGDINAWKGVLAQSVSSNAHTHLWMNTEEGCYSCKGYITGLVDQGGRYQIMYPTTTITLDRINGLKPSEGNVTTSDGNTVNAELHDDRSTVSIYVKVDNELYNNSLCDDMRIDNNSLNMSDSIKSNI